MRFVRTPQTDREWRRGNLSWLLRRHGQKKVYDFVGERARLGTCDPVIINAHRRLGKSFCMVLMCLEDCLRRPRRFTKYVCGTYEQVREIVVPIFDLIMETKPDDVKVTARGYQWKFHNPAWGLPRNVYSTFKMVGANYRKGDMGRGPACDRACLDEVRDYDALQYFFENVLIYQFVGREDPLIVMTTTPPKSMDHDFTRPHTGFVPRAIEKGNYLVVPSSQNEDFTQRDREIILQTISGGEGGIAWRREAECELISDEEDLITPEFQEAKATLVVPEYKRPDWFIPYVCMDTGYDPDHTAILFGYLDFLEQLLIYEYECVRRRMTTADIAEQVHKIEKLLGYDKNPHGIRRVADMDKRGLEDLRKDHRLAFRAVDKYDSLAALARFRALLQQQRIRVSARNCPQLCYQLEHGIWNERGTDFARSESMGHWDAGKAAVYLARKINFRESPFIDPFQRIGLPARDPDAKKFDKSRVLMQVFGRKPL